MTLIPSKSKKMPSFKAKINSLRKWQMLIQRFRNIRKSSLHAKSSLPGLRRRRRKLPQKRNSKRPRKLSRISKTSQLSMRKLRTSLNLLRGKRRESTKNLPAKIKRLHNARGRSRSSQLSMRKSSSSFLLTEKKTS